MRLGIFQFKPTWGDKEANLEKICDTLSDYAGINLWVLPELCTTGYQFTSSKEISDLAEEFPAGQTSEEIKSLSKKIKSTIVLGVLEKSRHGFFNSAAVFDQGDFLGIYRKIHLFSEEKKWFLPGTVSPPIFKINSIKVGVMICFDWIFPEIAQSEENTNQHNFLNFGYLEECRRHLFGIGTPTEEATVRQLNTLISLSIIE